MSTVYEQGSSFPAGGPLASRCTTAKRGRNLTIGVHEQHQRTARAIARDPAWQNEYRQHRHHLGHRLTHRCTQPPDCETRNGGTTSVSTASRTDTISYTEFLTDPLGAPTGLAGGSI
jgi:hypothetical protein